VQGAALLPVVCCPLASLTLTQGLPTSPAAIAVAALRKRESLSRDVERELRECSHSLETAAQMQDMVGGGGEQDGFGWKIDTVEREGGDDEEDMFAFDDEPCNVRCCNRCVIL
jgi:hypothetical protein